MNFKEFQNQIEKETKKRTAGDPEAHFGDYYIETALDMIDKIPEDERFEIIIKAAKDDGNFLAGIIKEMEFSSSMEDLALEYIFQKVA